MRVHRCLSIALETPAGTLQVARRWARDKMPAPRSVPPIRSGLPDDECLFVLSIHAVICQQRQRACY
jgi:hypothetical protein